MKWLKRIAIVLGALLVLVLAGGGIFVWTQVSAFDASMSKVYDVPVPALVRSTDPAVIARGKHLAESITACAGRDCHGTDFGGNQPMSMGPLGTIAGPNISPAGLGAAYSDGELARLIRHGVKKSGTSVLFMPSQDLSWLPDADVVAVISYLRTVPPVERPNGATNLGILAKVLDRQGALTIDVARKVDHGHVGYGSPPAPTTEYGKLLAKVCTGCHGDKLSGGPIPGAPASLPTPTNLTPHPTGLRGWSYDDFDRLLVQGIRKDGKKLDPFMPIEMFGKMDDVEKRALFAFLQTLTPIEFGNR